MKKVLFLLFAVLILAACNNTNPPAEQTENNTEMAEDVIEVAIIDVTGMHCGSCEKTVTNALTELEGVKDAKVSLEEEQAKVKFSASKVSIDDFKTAIEGKGYGVARVEIIKIDESAGDQ